MSETKKPTLGPIECDHCHKVWYGSFHKDSYVPAGKKLCLSCWSALDDYLFRNFRQIYNLSWDYMNPESIPLIHVEAEKWIANPAQKPLRPKNIYRGGGVPKWMQSAIDKGLARTNSEDVYIITVEGSEAVNVETSQDRTLLKGKRRKVGMW